MLPPAGVDHLFVRLPVVPLTQRRPLLPLFVNTVNTHYLMSAGREAERPRPNRRFRIRRFPFRRVFATLCHIAVL